MLLHTVSKSPNSSDALSSCLRAALADSTVLLIEDGVYAAVIGTSILDSPSSPPRYCALRADIQARGLDALIRADVTLVDYTEFVELAAQAHAVQSWY